MAGTEAPLSAPHTWDGLDPLVAPWALICPDWLAATEAPYQALWTAVDPGLLDLARQRMAMLLRAEPPTSPAWIGPDHAAKVAELAQWPGSPLFGDADRAVVAFAEQFVMDVGAMEETTRRPAADVLGDKLATFAQALYLVDMGLRLDMLLPRLFGVAGPVLPGIPAEPPASVDLWASIQPMSAAAGRLHRIDPLTVELSRLRIARTHRCRICSSRRNLSALRSVGGDLAFLDQVDDYEHSSLSERHKVVLRLTDAFLTQPAEADGRLVADVRSQLTPVEAVELLVRGFRNTVNKFAVALGTDEAHVPEGIEVFDIDEAGVVLAAADAEQLQSLLAGAGR